MFSDLHNQFFGDPNAIKVRVAFRALVSACAIATRSSAVLCTINRIIHRGSCIKMIRSNARSVATRMKDKFSFRDTSVVKIEGYVGSKLSNPLSISVRVQKGASVGSAFTFPYPTAFCLFYFRPEAFLYRAGLTRHSLVYPELGYIYG